MFKQKSDPTAAALSPADAVQQARTRARQRLIGAIVLLGIGIIGFPLVFETQPRPIPVDIPIEIPRKDGVPPLVAPPAPAASGGIERSAPVVEPAKGEVITESRSDSGREVAPPRAASSAAAPATAAMASSAGRAASSLAAAPAVPRAAVASASAPTAVALPLDSARRTAAATAAPPARPPEVRTEAERARALLEGRQVDAVAAQSQRFVVQVGAFADAEAGRETRQKVEKLGLKTYTQVAQTSGGNRIRVRVGPFASRADADAALAKAKAAGLAAVVLTI